MRTVFILLLIALSLATVSADEVKRATDAPQPMSPKDSKSQMRLPPGFRIELVASEPVIQEPSCIAFDDRGRIFVTELHGYNVEGEIDVAELNKTGKLDTEVRRLRWEFMGGKVAEAAKQRQYGKVKLLKDKDGDGQMDESIVWADDLPSAYGVIPARDGIIVVAAPDIVFLADRDGDDKPEVRETLFTGFKKREMERGINNPRWGIDNWIYVGAGGHGGGITGPHLEEAVDLHHSDFRIKADGSAIEPVTGRVGTFGLALNDAGDRFPCSGGQPAIYALPMPYDLLTRNPDVAMPSTNHSAADYGRGFRISEPHPWRTRRRSDPAWIKFYGNRETDSNYFTGGCGGEIYTADLFPPEYHGNFFYCEPSLNIIHRCVLSRDGAGYQAKRAESEKESEFLASKDQWFRPMNLRVGPDGALYIIDMYREIIEDYSAIPRFLQQQYGLDKGRDKGRIWRLLPNTTKSVEPPKHSTNIEAALSGLSNANMKNRLAAQRSIVKLVSNSTDPNIAKRVATLLANTMAENGVAKTGNSADARLHALHVLAAIDCLEPTHLEVALGDDDYRIRLHALRLASGEYLSEAVVTKIQAMAQIDSIDSDPAVRLQLALTIGELPDPESGLANLAVLHSDQRWMLQAIASSASQCASELLQRLMNAQPLPTKAIPILDPLATTIGANRDHDAIQKVLAQLPNVDGKVSTMCLTGLRRGLQRGNEPSDNVLDDAEMESFVKHVLTPARGKQDDNFQAATQVAAKLFPANSKAGTWLFGEMAKAATRDGDSLESRQFAITVLKEAPPEILKAVTPKILDSRQPPTLQLAMVDSLSGSGNPQVAELLLARWKSYTPDVRKHVLSALLNRSHLAPAILDAIEDGSSVRAADLSDSQKELLYSTQNAAVSQRANAIFSSRTTDAELATRIETYQKALVAKRDLEDGRQVFAKTCLNCHQLGKEGHEVGPALGSLLNKPDEAILVDILDPSAKVDSEYTSYTVVTSSGQTFAGVLTTESPTSIRLKMEKGETREVLRNEIDAMKASDVSLMPSNLHEQIRPQAMANLLAYMRKAYAARHEN